MTTNVLFYPLVLLPLLAAAELPEGGLPLLSAASLAEVRGAADALSHGAGWRLRSDEAGHFWRVQWLAPLDRPVRKGSLLVVRFAARCIHSQDETGAGWIQVNVQRAAAPWNKSINRQVSITPEWTTYTYADLADSDYAVRELNAGFGAGAAIQEIEVRDVQIYDYGDRLTVADIPVTRATYAGREADAPWRKSALRRIHALRGGILRLRMLDQDGDPLADAAVEVCMRRHAFAFGSALKASLLLGQDETSMTYRRQIQAHFNAGSLENAFKWPAWDGEWGVTHYGRDVALRAVRWGVDQGLHMRGHVVVWPGWHNLPRTLKHHADDPEALRAAVIAHIDDIAVAAKPWIAEWDVVNEPFTNHDLMDMLGQDVIADWFRHMRQHLPDTPLALNECGILTTPVDNAHQAHLEALVRRLIEQQTPIDVLGLQGHFGGQPTGIPRILTVLDRFAALGLPIRITEFDVDTDDEVLQADFTRDFYMAAFSHPSVIGIQQWGFWEGAHWRPRAAMFRRDWSPKPNADAFRALVHDRWCTREILRADKQGRAECYTLYGEYDLNVRAGARRQTFQICFADAGGEKELVVKE